MKWLLTLYWKPQSHRSFFGKIQLFRETLSEKSVHATTPKGNKGYDQYSVPDTVG